MSAAPDPNASHPPLANGSVPPQQPPLARTVLQYAIVDDEEVTAALRRDCWRMGQSGYRLGLTCMIVGVCVFPFVGMTGSRLLFAIDISWTLAATLLVITCEEPPPTSVRGVACVGLLAIVVTLPLLVLLYAWGSMIINDNNPLPLLPGLITAGMAWWGGRTLYHSIRFCNLSLSHRRRRERTVL